MASERASGPEFSYTTIYKSSFFRSALHVPFLVTEFAMN